jgi:S1-C subfamily serine protease
MDYLDIAIIVLTLIFAISGFRRGVSWMVLSMLGLLLGLLLGALFAPRIARAVSHETNVQSLIAIGLFLCFVLVFQGIGTTIGFNIRSLSLHTALAPVDSAFGVILGIIGSLAGAWYLGLTFSQSPWVPLDDQIHNSAIEKALDSFFPRPPGFLADIENTLRGSVFPNVFSSIAPNRFAPIQIPPLLNTLGVRAAASVTEKVIAIGCGGGEAGSSWPIAAQYLVTNAHVVAGASRVDVDLDAPGQDGSAHPATVVFFDPNVDLAVLYVPSLNLPPLHVATSDPPRGTSGAVIGYPGGGGLQVVAAAVAGTENARGYNIYGDSLVTRDIEVLATHVIPGNSGGPMVDTNGTVEGLVFAASTTVTDEGYALTMTEIMPDLKGASGRTAAVSTQSCIA